MNGCAGWNYGCTYRSLKKKKEDEECRGQSENWGGYLQISQTRRRILRARDRKVPLALVLPTPQVHPVLDFNVNSGETAYPLSTCGPIRWQILMSNLCHQFHLLTSQPQTQLTAALCLLSTFLCSLSSKTNLLSHSSLKISTSPRKPTVQSNSGHFQVLLSIIPWEFNWVFSHSSSGTCSSMDRSVDFLEVRISQSMLTKWKLWWWVES